MQFKKRIGKPIFKLIMLTILSAISISSYSQKYDWSRLDGAGAHGWNTASWGGGAQDMVADDYGNLYSCGSVGGYWGSGSLDFGNNITVSAGNNYSTPYVVKYNREGECQWATALSASTWLYVTAIALDTGGNTYIMGPTWNQSVSSIAGFQVDQYGQGDIWVVKVNKDGVPQWAITVGGNLQDYPTGITCAADGTVYLTGLYQGYFQFGTSGISGSNSGWSVFVLKLKPDGDPVWGRKIATTDGTTAWYTAGGDVEVDRFNNLYVSGGFTGNLLAGNRFLSAGNSYTDQNGFVMRLMTQSGLVMWGVESGFTAQALASDEQGYVYVGGRIQTGADTFGTSVLGGNQGYDDIYLGKLDANGTFQWVERFGDNTTNYTGGGWWWNNTRVNASSLSVDYTGKILFSGNTDRSSDTGSICDFYVPSFTNTNLSWNWQTDAFLLKVDNQGNCLWNARSGIRDTALTSWAYSERSMGGGVCTDNAGATYWKTNRWWTNNLGSDTMKLFFNSDTISVAAEGGLEQYTPAIWALRENWIEVDTLYPNIVCPGDTITVKYTKHDPFVVGNDFKIMLSNAGGNLYDAIEIGMITDTASGTIIGVVPLTTPPGSQFKVRVDGTKPAVRGYPSETLLSVIGKPETDAGVDQEICFGDSIQLSPGSVGINKAWFPHPTLFDTAVVNTYVKPDTSTLYYMRSDDPITGCYNIDTVEIKVKDHPFALPRPDTTICQGESVWLYSRGTGGVETQYYFEWRKESDNSLVGQGDSVLVDPRNTTIYNVILYDSCSIRRDTVPVTVNVRAALAGNPRSDTLICIGEDVNVYALPTGGLPSGYDYQWFVGDDTTLYSADSSFVFPSVDTTTQLKLVLSDGCSDMNDTAFFKAFRRQQLQVFPRSDTLICVGESISLDVFGVGGYAPTYTFSWDQGVGQGSAPVVTPPVSTTYQVILTDGCTNLADTGSVTINVRQPLNVSVRPDTTICKGESLLMYVSGTGGDSLAYTFTWDNLGQGLYTIEGNYILETPAQTKTMYVTLRDNCTSTSTTGSIVVTVRDPLEITTSSDTLICQENTAALRAWGSGGHVPDYEFVWNDGSGETVLPAGVAYPVTPTSNTNVSVKLRDNCTVIEDSSTIQVDLRPGLNVTTSVSDTFVCQGAPLYITAQGTGGVVANHNFFWEHIGNGSTLNFSPMEDTTLSVFLSDGCSPWDTATIDVTIREPLEVETNQDTLICPGQPVVLIARADGGLESGYQYSWNQLLGNGNVKNVNPMQTTTYVVTAIDGCSVNAHDTVVVNISPLPSTAFTIADTVGCQPFNTVFNSSYGTVAPLSNWYWRWGDGTTSSVSTSQTDHTFEDPGIHAVKLIVTSDFGCVDSSYEQQVLVHPKPSADYSATPEKTDITKPTVQFINSSGPAIAYAWDFGDGIGVSNSKSPIYKFADTGTYMVSLEVSSEFGCTDQKTKPYRVNEIYTCFIPNAFTPNKNDLNDGFSISATGIDELHIEIYDRWGGLVFESDDLNFVWDGSMRNSGEALPGGAYAYKLSVTLTDGGKRNYNGTVLLLR